jgi:hypothetical protein
MSLQSLLITSALLASSALRAQTPTKPCVAAPPDKPTIVGRLWHKAKTTAQNAAEKQLGKADGTVGALTHGQVNPDTRGTADQAINEAEKPKPCTGTKETK